MAMTLNEKDSKAPVWVKTWFLLSSIVVLWDAGYCLLRPYSMEGGTLNFIWKPYNLYAKIDHFYGVHALNSRDGFTGAQSTMNVIESVLNLVYVWLLNRQDIPVGQANLIGFGSALMTLSKTVLYWLIEPFSGYQHIGHNTTKDLLFLWIIPNGVWIVVPAIIVITLGKDILSRLSLNDQKNK